MATLLIARCPDDDFTQPATPLKPWLTTPSGVVVMDKYLSGDFWVISAVQVSARAIIAALGVPPLTSFGLSSVTRIVRLLMFSMAVLPPSACTYFSRMASTDG